MNRQNAKHASRAAKGARKENYHAHDCAQRTFWRRTFVRMAFWRFKNRFPFPYDRVSGFSYFKQQEAVIAEANIAAKNVRSVRHGQDN